MNLAVLYSSGDNDETRHSKIKISAVTDVVTADQRDSDVNVGINVSVNVVVNVGRLDGKRFRIYKVFYG